MSATMTHHHRGTALAAGPEREFWRGVLLAGGSTALPRWTLNPVPGVGAHELRIPDQLTAALRGLASALKVPLSLVLLTAHAKVLGALSGEREVCTGYAVEPGAPLPLRISLRHRSWCEVMLEAARAELELQAHWDFPVDDLSRELGLDQAPFETVFELAPGGELDAGTVLRVAFVQRDGLVLRLRYRTDVLDA